MGSRPHHRRLRWCHRRPRVDQGSIVTGFGLAWWKAYEGPSIRRRPTRDLRHHGRRAAGAARGLFGRGLVTATAGEYVGAAAPVTTGMPLAQVACLRPHDGGPGGAPFFAYPVFSHEGAVLLPCSPAGSTSSSDYVGLLSFGSRFLGAAGYAAAHSGEKVWGFRPELAILFGTVVRGGSRRRHRRPWRSGARASIREHHAGAPRRWCTSSA